ncbi:MAG: GNAT family N-acetyltransferase [Candidatus Cloacimonetes bacterium]|nr:GNAT family N-acetyltransferase [Candidatus Cloacimonadota bacterium]
MIIIRKAECHDLRQISYVHVDTWRDAYHGIIDQQVLDKLSYGRSQDNWKRCQERMSQYFYVAENDNIIVGFITGGRQREEELLYDAEVYAMYVLPEFQKQGIGKMLLEKLVQDFHHENWQQFIIWCLQKNPAKAFYESLGGVHAETAKIRIGGRPLVKNGYLFDTEGFLNQDSR